MTSCIFLFLRTLGTNWKQAMQRTRHLMVVIIIIFTVSGSVAVPLMSDLSKVQRNSTKVINENIYKLKWGGCGKGTLCYKQCVIRKLIETVYDLDKKLGKNESIKAKQFKKRKSVNIQKLKCF